jgi:hypothetical protein
MAKRSPNWGQVGNLLPIASLADAYTGPVVLAHVSDTETVRWFSAKGADKSPVEHVEHVRDEQGFAFDDHGKPVTKTTQLKPTHWAVAEVTP